ncbi:MAG: hypothetical protein ABI840_06535 [bacterium]
MTITNKPNWKLALGIPLCIFIACLIITLTSKFESNQELLSNAIIIDLIISAPLIYFLAIRKSNVSKLTVLRIFVIGVLIAGWILNDPSNVLLKFIKAWALPIIEGVIIFFIVRKFYIANRKAKLSGENNIDFLIHCRKIMSEVTGNEKAGNIISSEIGVLYYAFFGWKDKNIDYKSKFTVYKENGILIIFGTFLSLFIIETTGVHFLLNLWNSTLAWVITALSLYTCLQLFAHMRAVKARPITLNNNKESLEIYNGLAGDAIINYDNIEKIELSDKIPIDRKVIKIALLRKLEKHNCIIYLKQPVQVTIIFGIRKSSDTVLFFVDSLKDFAAALNLRLTGKAG